MNDDVRQSPFIKEHCTDNVRHGLVEGETEIVVSAVVLVDLSHQLFRLIQYLLFNGCLADAEVTHRLKRQTFQLLKRRAALIQQTCKTHVAC